MIGSQHNKIRRLTDPEYLGVAYLLAQHMSTHPQFQAGAIIVDPRTGQILMGGSARFPTGVVESKERMVHGSFIESAEICAIALAAKNGIVTNGTKMYTNAIVSESSARAIVFAGIKDVVLHKRMYDMIPERKTDDALQILKEAGVTVTFWDGRVSDHLESITSTKNYRLEVKFNGKALVAP
jgi:deoxycytidylate deaminase